MNTSLHLASFYHVYAYESLMKLLVNKTYDTVLP